jgi:integrase
MTPEIVSESLVVEQPATATLAAIDASGAAYDAQSRSDATKRAYRADWQDFCAWCQHLGLESLPASENTVARYLTQLAEGSYEHKPADQRKPLKVATLTRRLASISQAHQLAGHHSPTASELVRTRMKGIRRALGTRQDQAAAATIEVVRAMVYTLPEGNMGLRDRALLLVGFAGAFRRSELVALNVADIRFVPEGMIVTLRRSKTNQEGATEEIGIARGRVAETCPVRSLQAWLNAARITEGPIFRPLDKHDNVRPRRLTDHAVGLIVKRAAERAGLDPTPFSGHSLRAGLVTSAYAADIPEHVIQAQTRHHSERMLRSYKRSGTLFTQNASGKVGL